MTGKEIGTNSRTRSGPESTIESVRSASMLGPGTNAAVPRDGDVVLF
jgi:hypothetical protein